MYCNGYVEIEHSDNYSDTSESLWWDDHPADNANLGLIDNKLNSKSFKYKAPFTGKIENNVNDTNSSVKT